MRSVELRGMETVRGLPNIRAPLVKTLILSHPEVFSVRRPSQFFWIVKLKLYMTDQYVGTVGIWNRLDQIFFPRLEELEVDFGIVRFTFDLALLYALPTLRILRINILGSILIYSMTSDRFPSLRCVILNADYVSLFDLPPHEMLRMIVYPPDTDHARLTDDTENWPRLSRSDYFRNNLDLTLSDTEDEASSSEEAGPTIRSETTRLLNFRIGELAIDFDRKEEELRAERIRRPESKSDMEMDDGEIKECLVGEGGLDVSSEEM